MKLLFDESISPRLVLLLGDLFPGSESALQNGVACAGDRRILDYAAVHDFILVPHRSVDGAMPAWRRTSVLQNRRRRNHAPFAGAA